jgi:hypothetical protein
MIGIIKLWMWRNIRSGIKVAVNTIMMFGVTRGMEGTINNG